MITSRLPVYFVSHGGGPWPYVESMRTMFAVTERELAALPARLGIKPRAILAISGHWEAPAFTVSTSARPPMEYDYFGFPEHTYHVTYPAPGAPEVSSRVRTLLASAGIAVAEDASRGFDHGVFVPLHVMYPEADVPVVMLSLKSGYDPAEHIRIGAALAPLRDEGVLIVGSGATYHNMRGFGTPEAISVSKDFDAYLDQAISQDSAAARNALLSDWAKWPSGRLAHPREDHLVPLMVIAGAAGEDTGHTLFVDHVFGIPNTSYEFGGTQAR